MKVLPVASILAFDKCIERLKERPTKTRYHPEEDRFYIDTYIMARVLWHGGNLIAKVSPDEAHLCSFFIDNLISQQVVTSLSNKNKYVIIESEVGNRKSILVRKKRILEKTVGRKPKFLKVVDTQGVGIDG